MRSSRKTAEASGGCWLHFILVGIVILTSIFHGKVKINYQILWRLAASISYSLVIISSSNIASGFHIIDKARLLNFDAFMAWALCLTKTLILTQRVTVA
ncbi:MULTISPECIES: hypothetical protein [unclassified Pantoea]|uniref:hypothetical protein n=1 Tax=unclassified Pantoea TaxID=2630326 RepID=UPI002557208F|nr:MULTISPECIES: hypothetical protein [unclassified Pantoea]